MNEDKCTIALLAYNQLEFTKVCIESLRKYTRFPYKIVVVDNDSTDGTKEWLKEAGVEVIHNPRNMGFGYANNQILRKLDTKYVCILNNDTILTQDWLGRLIQILDGNPEAGMVGPVTNRIGSALQKVEVDYNNPVISAHAPIAQSTAKKLYKSYGDENFEVMRLIGYCMVTTRDMINDVGVFDDRYFPGNFEDDDLSLRFAERGHKLLVAKGVFIYHFQGTTFNKLEKTSMNEILSVNRDRHFDKWYTSGRINEVKNVKFRPRILFYIESDTPCGGNKVVFEYANRLQDRGFDVKIVCNRETGIDWFDIHVPMLHSRNFKNLPDHDIAIGSFYTTLNSVQSSAARFKFHLCQGYEGLYSDPKQQGVIEKAYELIPNKIVVSNPLKKIIEGKFIDSNCFLIQNGLEPYDYIYRQDIESKELPKDRPIKVLVTGSEYLRIKGVNEAMKALGGMINKGLIEVYRMSPEPDYDNSMPYQKFHYMPGMTQEEITQAYMEVDITLSASWNVEGFSLHQLESMALGVPVISTDCGGINHYGTNEENCLIVPPQDSKALSDVLLRLTSDAELYRKLSKNGIKTAKSFAWHFSIDKLEKLLFNSYNGSQEDRSKITLSMIVKNEEHVLRRCLESVKGLVTEIIIVDTGSIDDTISIAKKHGAKIYNYEWDDNFSNARNFSLEKATGDWVLILDADEFLDIEGRKKIIDLCVEKGRTAYSVTTWNYYNDPAIEGWQANPGKYVSKDEFNGFVTSEKIRLFSRDERIKWKGEVHELVEASIGEIGLTIENSGFIVHHDKSKQDAEKDKKYLRLSNRKAESGEIKSLTDLGIQYMSIRDNDSAIVEFRKVLEVTPDDATVLAFLGVCHSIKEEFKLSEKYLRKALKQIPSLLYASKHLAILFGKMGRFKESYTTFKEIELKINNDLKSLVEFGFICNSVNNFQEAIINLEKARTIDESYTLSKGILECSYNGMGIFYGKKGFPKEAVTNFRKAIQINPSFKEAKINLERTLEHCKAVGLEID